MIDGVREERAQGAEFLRAYQARMSRSRRIYALVVAAIVAVCVVGVVIAYQVGSISHVRHQRFGAAAAAPTLGAVSAQTLTSRWTSAEHLALGAPVYANLVVTWSGDEVRARDVLTGKVVWTYARTDRTVCSVAQEQGKTVILFRAGSNCDELNTLVTSDGSDSWQRTLSTDSATIDGTPRTLPETDGIDYVTPTAIVKVSVSSATCDSGSDCGVNWWSFVPSSGCTVTGYAAGSGGALIATKCASGYQLILHDRYSGDENKQILFTTQLSEPAVPIAAGSALIAYLPRSHRVEELATSNGAVQQSVSADFASGLDPIRVDAEFRDQLSVVCDGTRCVRAGPPGLIAALTTDIRTAPLIDSDDGSVYGIGRSGALVQLSEAGVRQQSWALPDGGYTRAYRVSNGFVVGGDGASTAFVS